jgi:hypothetical protein
MPLLLLQFLQVMNGNTMLLLTVVVQKRKSRISFEKERGVCILNRLFWKRSLAGGIIRRLVLVVFVVLHCMYIVVCTVGCALVHCSRKFDTVIWSVLFTHCIVLVLCARVWYFYCSPVA